MAEKNIKGVEPRRDIAQYPSYERRITVWCPRLSVAIVVKGNSCISNIKPKICEGCWAFNGDAEQ